MTIPRTVFGEEQEMFRATVKDFIAREIAPHHDKWEKDGVVSREVWRKAGEAGLLLTGIPEEYGGAGANFLMSAVLIEEMSKGLYTGPGFRLHSDIVAPYILHYGSEEQKRSLLPRMARGEIVTAIAMTEPGTGSDLQGIRTTAIRQGNELVVNGQKTYITNGQLADVIIVACKTDPKEGAKGISLVLVEAERAGFARGRNLEKIGNKAQDTSELFFENVRVPPSNILGAEGRGFSYLMQELPQERLIVGLAAVAIMEAALEWTLAYTKDRKAFGRPIAERSRPRPRSHACSSTNAWNCISKANSMCRRRRCRSGGSQNSRAAYSTSAFNSTAAPGSCPSIRSRAPTPTPAFTASLPAPPKS